MFHEIELIFFSSFYSNYYLYGLSMSYSTVNVYDFLIFFHFWNYSVFFLYSRLLVSQFASRFLPAKTIASLNVDFLTEEENWFTFTTLYWFTISFMTEYFINTYQIHLEYNLIVLFSNFINSIFIYS